jgi:anaphase-promoting complex subunit 4
MSIRNIFNSISVERFSLLNLFFSPHSSQGSTVSTNSAPPFSPTYVPFDPSNGVSIQPSSLNVLDPWSNAHADIVIHSFPSSGLKAKPIRIDVNGREGRRVICALYRDSLRYDVFDLDSQAGETGGVKGTDATSAGNDENSDEVMAES